MALNATWYSFNVHPQEATVLVKGSTMLWEDWLLQCFHAADNDNGYLFLVTILRSNFGLLPYETFPRRWFSGNAEPPRESSRVSYGRTMEGP